MSLGEEAHSEVCERLERGKTGREGIGAGPDRSSSGCDNGVILILPELLDDRPR